MYHWNFLTYQFVDNLTMRDSTTSAYSIYGSHIPFYGEKSCKFSLQWSMWAIQGSIRTRYRSSHQRCSVRKGFVRNFAKVTGKHLCQKLRYRCFPVNFAKFLRTPFLQNTSGRLFLQMLLCLVINSVICMFSTHMSNKTSLSKPLVTEKILWKFGG